MRRNWSESDIKHIIKTLESYPKNKLSEALAAISKHYKTDVTQATLDSAFKRRGLPSAMSHMLDTPYVFSAPEVAQKNKSAKDKQALKAMQERIYELEARQEFIDAVNKAAPEYVVYRREKGVKREWAAVCLASDWHVEETVDKITVNGVNEYNLGISEKRIERYFKAIAWNLAHHRADGDVVIRDLVLWLGGDLISGYIHQELVETNELSPSETLIWLIPRLKAGINLLLAQDLVGLTIPCSYGNHGRTTEKRQVSSGAANSFEWLMYNWLASEFKDDKRVKFIITASPHQYVTVFDQVLHFHHGDELRYGGGVNGLAVPVNKAVGQWNKLKHAHIHNIGHFHQLLDLGDAVVNGSLIGYNAFAQSIRANPEPPQQAMYFIDSKRGKCHTSALWVS